MISEQDKQAILDGVLARTNNNKKAKFILKSEHEANFNYPYLFLISDKDKCYTDWYNEHLNSKQDKFNSSIVELWQDEPEPFDPNKALAGRPVMTRDGSKAYIQVSISQPKGLEHYCFIGFGCNGEHKEFLHWDETGRVIPEDETCDDIIGMWTEPEPVSNTVTLTLPCPLKEPKEGMWFINSIGEAYESNYKGEAGFYDDDSFNAGHRARVTRR